MKRLPSNILKRYEQQALESNSFQPIALTIPRRVLNYKHGTAEAVHQLLQTDHPIRRVFTSRNYFSAVEGRSSITIMYYAKEFCESRDTSELIITASLAVRPLRTCTVNLSRLCSCIIGRNVPSVIQPLPPFPSRARI